MINVRGILLNKSLGLSSKTLYAELHLCIVLKIMCIKFRTALYDNKSKFEHYLLI